MSAERAATHEDSLTKPALLVGVSMVLWVCTEVTAGITLKGTPIPLIVWLRYLFHLVLMIAAIAPREGLAFVRTSRPVLQTVRSLLMLIMPVSYGLAIRQASGRDVLGVFWIAPLLVLLFAPLARDRPAAVAWLLAGVGWIGALFIYRPRIATMDWALAPALLMAASFSLYVVLTRILDRTETVLTNMFHSALAVWVALTLALPWFWTPLSARHLVGGAAVGVLGWLVLAALDLGLRRASPSCVATVLFVQVLFEEFVRPLVFGHLPRRSAALGGVLVVAALAATFFRLRTTAAAHSSRQGSGGPC